MPSPIEGRVVAVVGAGGEAQRGVAVALATAGASIAVLGRAADRSAEAALHSIANEVWALGRRSTVATLPDEGAAAFAEALREAETALGRIDLVVRVEAVVSV
jgi:3-oxoacyl-[acyl-carrier protein] reductase